MKLGIVSDAQHYYDSRGRLCVLEIVARQFEQWALLFDEVVVCAPLLEGPPPATHAPYRAGNLCLIPIPNAGGNTPAAKLDLLKKARQWRQSLEQLFGQVDAVHIRCPNNISILGLLALQQTSLLRQAVYTGTWNGYAGEPITYRWQRLFLRRWFRGPVAVYGEWPNQPAHIVPSFSPSYSQVDWDQESDQVDRRIDRLSNQARLPEPIRLLSVGALNQNKNQRLVIQALKIIHESGRRAELHLLGDGNQRSFLERLATEAGLAQQVTFHGHVAQNIVRQQYRQGDFVLQAPYAEGFGKVPIEAFFHGVIPVLSNAGMSAQIVGEDQRGRIFSPGDASDLALHVIALANQPAEMIRLIQNGRLYAKSQTLEAWRGSIVNMLNQYWPMNLNVLMRGAALDENQPNT